LSAAQAAVQPYGWTPPQPTAEPAQSPYQMVPVPESEPKLIDRMNSGMRRTMEKIPKPDFKRFMPGRKQETVMQGPWESYTVPGSSTPFPTPAPAIAQSPEETRSGESRQIGFEQPAPAVGRSLVTLEPPVEDNQIELKYADAEPSPISRRATSTVPSRNVGYSQRPLMRESDIEPWPYGPAGNPSQLNTLPNGTPSPLPSIQPARRIAPMAAAAVPMTAPTPVPDAAFDEPAPYQPAAPQAPTSAANVNPFGSGPILATP
jgi:hypothetical protein